MEQGILVERTRQELVSAHASKSSQSHTTIDSISINLNGNEENEVQKCEHFTIRGLTAKMRKENGKLCWPFDVDGKDKKSEEIVSMLPPLVVPSFRWWRCKNCLIDVDVKGASECCYGNTVENNAEDTQNTDDKKEKKAVAAETTISNHVNGWKCEVNFEVPTAACEARKCDLFLMLKSHAGDSALEPNASGLAEKCKPDSGNKGVVDTAQVVGNLNCQIANNVSVFDQQKKLVKPSGTSSVDHIVDRPISAATDHTRTYPSPEIDADNATFEADENLDKCLLQDQQHDDSCGLNRRKTRKVRLLTELLNENETGSASAEQSRIDNFQSKESIGIGSGSVSPSLVAIQGNHGRVCRGQKKKKKTPNDPEWKHPKLILPHKFKKKCKRHSETSTFVNVGSKLIEDTAVTIGRETDAKHHMNEHGIDTHPISQMKNKMPQDGNGFLSLFPSREAVPSKTQIRIGDSDKNSTANTASEYQSVASRVRDPSQSEKESSFHEMKDELLQVQDRQASSMLYSNSIQRKNSISRKNLEIVQSGPEFTPFQPVHDEYSRKGLYLSPESYLAAHKNNWKGVSHFENELNSVMPSRQGISTDQVMRKHEGINCVGESSIPSKSSSDAIIWKGVNKDTSLKKATHGTSSTIEKQTFNVLSSNGDLSFSSKMDFSGKSKNANMDAVQEHLEKQCSTDQGAKNGFEQGALDDIPMEIVELLARNQYERRLHEARSSRLEKTSKPRNGVDYTRIYANGALRLPGKHKVGPESQSNDANSNTPTGGKIPTKQVINFFPQCSPAEGTRKTYSFCQSNQSKAVAPPSGSHGNDNSRKERCDGNMLSLGHKFSPSSLHAFKPYDTCQNAPQQSEKAIVILSPMAQNLLPYSTQNCAAESFNNDMPSRSPSHLHKGNIRGGSALNLDLNLADGERQNRNFNSETFKMDAENPYAFPSNEISIQSPLLGSKDTNSNETVSAMYLLSLMDPGMQSTPPTLNMDDHTKVLKRPSFTPDHQAKEFHEYFGACKTSHNLRHPSSDYNGKQNLSGTCQCSPIPVIGTNASSQQNDVSVRRATNIPSQNRLTTHEKGKSKCSYSSTGNSSHKLWKSAFSRVGFAINGNTIPFHPAEKKNFSASHLTMGSSQSHTVGYPLRFSDLVIHSPYRSQKRSSETEVCSVNRNPADFSMPEAGNVYMRGAEDLKFRKSKYSRDKSGLSKAKANGHKRQRITKLAAAKEWARHQIS